MNVTEKISSLIEQKAELQSEISKLQDRQAAIESFNRKRLFEAMTHISQAACTILRNDLPRQDEFQLCEAVSIDFAKNTISVDGHRNFAESSNVVLKNSAILALWVAACEDDRFWHPRFCLFDNIEDKGMEDIRSHQFQEILVEIANSARPPHQIIFTTSTISPKLDIPTLVVGPHYTREQRTLSFDNR